MKKPLLILTVTLASLFAASGAFAQKEVEGDRHRPSAAKASMVEKTDVKTVSAAKKVTKTAQAKRKTAEIDAAKSGK